MKTMHHAPITKLTPWALILQSSMCVQINFGRNFTIIFKDYLGSKNKSKHQSRCWYEQCSSDVFSQFTCAC